MVIGRKPQLSSKASVAPAAQSGHAKLASSHCLASDDDNTTSSNRINKSNAYAERSEEELDDCSGYSYTKSGYVQSYRKNSDESMPNNLSSSELKSASSSSLNTASGFSNHNSEQRLNHSYQNGNHPLAAMQPNRLRTLTAYDSPNSPTAMSISSNMGLTNHSDNFYLTNDLSAQRNLTSGSSQSLNKHTSLSNRPTSSSSNSSSQNFQQHQTHGALDVYNYGRQAYAHLSQQQLKINRQISTPSPTMLNNAMNSLGLNGSDSVPVSLPQRDFNYLVQRKV